MIDRIRTYWAMPFQPLRNDSLASIALPNDTRTSLMTVGLPVLRDAAMPPLYLRFTAPTTRMFEREAYLVIGSNTGVDLCIAANGYVVFIDDENAIMPRRFANSTIQAFLLFAGLYRTTAHIVNADDQQAVRLALDDLRHEYQQIDPQALANPEHVWSVVLADLASQL